MIVTKTPFRLSFFCGGSDMPAFYERETGAAFSITINKFVYVCTHLTPQPTIRVMFDTVQELDDLSLMDHRITKEMLDYANIRSGITVTSISDVTPKGSGLGASSAFTVGLIHAIANTQTPWGNTIKSVDPEWLARMACEIEIHKSGYRIGKQDQYAAAYGGANLFEFYRDGEVSRRPLNLSSSILDELGTRLLLVYTGRGRQASSILEKQSASITSSMDKFRLAQQNKNRAYEAVELLERQQFDDFGKLLHYSWMDKKMIVSDMSQTDIDAIYDRALAAGALGGKILGAGGGGFFVFYVNPPARQQVIAAVQQDPLCRVYDFKFDYQGSQLIMNDSQ